MQQRYCANINYGVQKLKMYTPCHLGTESRKIFEKFYSCMLTCSVMSDSLRPYVLWLTRLLCPWDFLGKNVSLYPLHWQADSLLSLIMQSKVENRHSRQNNTETKPHILYNLNCEFVHKSFLFT